MQSEDISKYAFLVVLGILMYFSFLVVRSLLSYLLFSAVLVILFFPAYEWLHKKTKRKRLSSAILVAAVILLLVLPAIWIGVTLIQQAPSAYETVVKNVDTTSLDAYLNNTIGTDQSVSEWAAQSVGNFRRYVVQSAPQFLTNATQVILGLFIMFFVMFFLFVQGEQIIKHIRKITPLSKRHTDALIQSIDQVVHGVMEGQVLTGLAQGLVATILFAVLGLPNAIFWGFVTAVFSMIPFVGSGVVWLPAGLWLLLQGEVWQGIVLLIVGALVISQMDNVLRPYLVGRYAEVHPALVLVGVIGGLAAFGIIGFVVGPLILALFIAFLRFYAEGK